MLKVNFVVNPVTRNHAPCWAQWDVFLFLSKLISIHQCSLWLPCTVAEISHCPQSDYLANIWPDVYFFIYLWHPELTLAQGRAASVGLLEGTELAGQMWELGGVFHIKDWVLQSCWMRHIWTVWTPHQQIYNIYHVGTHRWSHVYSRKHFSS